MGLHKPKQEHIEAIQNDGSSEQIEKIKSWIAADGGKCFQNEPNIWPEHLLILQGEKLIFSAGPSDWIVRAGQGTYFVLPDEHFKLMFT
jgi:hypothetical protein